MPDHLLERVRHWAQVSPKQTALESSAGDRISYASLASLVEECAAALAARGVSSGTRVLLEARRSTAFITTLLGCWRLGASAVPLDPERPPDVERLLLRRLGAAVDARATPATLSPSAASPSQTRPLSDDEAYVYFTSGSTGIPKGVRIAHAGLPHLWQQQSEIFRVTPTSRTSWMLAAHFDASISDIGVPLWSGATLVIRDEPSSEPRERKALDFVDAFRLTHVDLPPSQLRGLVAARDRFPRLETVIVGGEPAPKDVLQAAARSFRTINVYGPTETTVCASAEVVSPNQKGDVPSLGAPLAGVSFHLAPEDEGAGRGELYIGGWGVALGYAGDERASSKAFSDLSPPEPGPRQRVYRTGDLVERQEDGSWLFLGRMDRQVQLRGKRLELGEIESVLCSAPGVTAAAAVFVEHPSPQVEAFVEGSASSAIEACTLRLEPWKRPAKITPLTALPRLRNGKIDLRAIEALAEREHPEQRAHPSDPLGRAWCSVLGPSATGADDEDFFDLGGDSISALTFVAEAAREGVAVAAETIDAERTLGAIRRSLRSGTGVAELRERANAALDSLDLGQGSGAARGGHQENERGIVITGATGLLGTALLRTGAFRGRTVVAVVRGKDDDHARERLVRALGTPLPPDLRVLRGDLGQPQLGLSHQALSELQRSCSDFLHAAGAVDLVRSYPSLEDVHVHGTGRAMEVAARIGARFHYVSTLSIFVESDHPAGTITDESALSEDARIQGGYAQTKWVADALAQRFPYGGSVLRLGLLAQNPSEGDPRHTVSPHAPVDQLSRVIRGAAALGRWPNGLNDRRFDLTPVGCAADLIAHVVNASHSDPASPIHLASLNAATGELLRSAIEAEGASLSPTESWPPSETLEHLREDPPGTATQAADIAVTLAAFAPASPGLPRSGDLFLASRHRFECAYAAEHCPSALPPAPTLPHLRALVRAARGESKP